MINIFFKFNLLYLRRHAVCFNISSLVALGVEKIDCGSTCFIAVLFTNLELLLSTCLLCGSHLLQQC